MVLASRAPAFRATRDYFALRKLITLYELILQTIHYILTNFRYNLVSII